MHSGKRVVVTILNHILLGTWWCTGVLLERIVERYR